MFEKIVCPVDFSDASLNAVEYATQLAVILKSKLYLINVQPVLQSDLVEAGIGNLSVLKSHIEAARLRFKDMEELIQNTYAIECSSEVDVSYKEFDKVVAEAVTQNDLIVMGTNGIDNLYEFYFGSNAYHLLKHVKAPTLIVPEGCSFAPLKELVYALSYEKDTRNPIQFLDKLASQLNASITVLHVSKEETLVSREVFKSLDDIIDEVFKETANFNFIQLFSEDTVATIEKEMHKRENALLVLYAKELNLLDKLFDEKYIRKICEEANFPLLVIHEH